MTTPWIDNPIDEPSPTYASLPLPVFSLSSRLPHRTDEVELKKYYADRKLMLRNIVTIGTATIGWSVALQIVTPLIATRLLDLGVHENVQGTINSINQWAVSFLVMLFGWMSDHTISRHGRRKPYLFIAAPFIIAAICIFPFFEWPQYVSLLLTLQVVYLLFMDLKNSTFALVMIDCVPGKTLARAMSVVTIVAGLVSFVANRYAAQLMSYGDKAPLLLAAGVMTLTTIVAAFVREPPVAHPRPGPFRPWSTFQATARYDKRLFLLMAGIALLMAFPAVCTQWLWLWSKQSLGFSRADIFQAVSWAGLANVALSYPIGWTIDRFGGLRIVLIFQTLCMACFVGVFFVHTKTSLTWLVIGQAIALPIYWSTDLLVFKSSPKQSVGAITSTNSCIRNAFLGCLSLLTGWMIYWFNHDYRVGFTIGAVLTTAGCGLCVLHQMKYTSRAIAAIDSPTANEIETLAAQPA